MQAIAAEFNLSETTFVSGACRIRKIMLPASVSSVATAEMAFAGHPMVGTAFVVAKQRPDLSSCGVRDPVRDCARSDRARVPDGAPVGAAIDAPQPLTIGETVAPEFIARALQLTLADVVTTHHAPVSVSNGNAFVVAENYRRGAVTLRSQSSCVPRSSRCPSAVRQSLSRPRLYQRGKDAPREDVCAIFPEPGRILAMM